ncbi:unnamed protein product, partial [Scytosiphon promiscuus]
RILASLRLLGAAGTTALSKRDSGANMSRCSFFASLNRSNGGAVPGSSSSARAAAAASAAARGLGFLSLFVSSSTQTSRLLHLSKHGGSYLGFLVRSISTRAPAATAAHRVSQRPARCSRLLLCSEHRGGVGTLSSERGNDSGRLRRRRGGGGGGLTSRVRRLSPQHSAIGGGPCTRRTGSSAGEPRWMMGALLSTTTTSAEEDSAAAAAAAAPHGDSSASAAAPAADDRATAGVSGEGAPGPEQEEQRRRVEGMVASISPSAVAAFKQCPQLFYYRYILRLKSPPTLETLKGIAVHEVLSLFFTLDEGSRGLDNLHEIFRKIMTELIAKEKEASSSRSYLKLFESREKEKTWIVECLDLLANFVTLERESGLDREGDPEHLELRMTHAFCSSEQTAEDGYFSENATVAGDAPAADEAAASAMSVVGIVDRIDRCPDGKLRVVDYKTGKVPDLKYPEATNKRIMDDKFFQLQIYALLVQRVLGEVPGEMRLVYLKGSTSTPNRCLDPSALPSVESELRSIWDDIDLSARRNDFSPRTSRLCDWCSFQDRCPAFGGEPE